MNAAIIAAGGSGERFGDPAGKQLAPVAGSALLAHTLRAFEACPAVDVVIVVAHPDRVDEYRSGSVEAIGARKILAVVAGGDTRRASVARGLAALPPEADLIAVHDGARAAIGPDTIATAFALLASAPGLDGVVVGHPSFDTVKEVGPDGVVLRTPDRGTLWIAQTPQVFRRDALERAHARAVREGFEGTDDASLVERDGGVVKMVAGPRWNLKVTVAEDLPVLEALLTAREEASR